MKLKDRGICEFCVVNSTLKYITFLKVETVVETYVPTIASNIIWSHIFVNLAEAKGTIISN